MDVSMLMHVSDRMLHGGKYGVDIFESNPPIIFYIYAIPVLAAKLFSMNFILSCRIYIFLLIFISLFVCNTIIKKTSKIPSILLPATAWVLLLPGVSFAQREHIMMILIMPYVYLSVASLYDISINKFIRVLIAVMAGIGFCIKPYFFLPFFICLLYSRKLTLENKIIISIPIIYLLSIAIFHSSYFADILPYVPFYYSYFDMNTAWSSVGIRCVFIILLIYFISLYFIPHHKLENILVIYTMGFLMVYVLQKSNWAYHLYPAIGFATLLAVQMIYRFIGLFKVISILAVSCLSIFPLNYYYLINHESVAYKKQNEFKIMQHLSELKNISSVYFLSNNPSPYPAVDYLNLKDVQRIQCYWFFPGLNRINNAKSREYLDYFNKLIVNDMMLKKPDVIVMSSRLFPGQSQNFTSEFFFKNYQFKKFMSQYKKIDSYDDIIIFSI